MSVIKLTLPGNEIPVNGKSVTFEAPCSCAAATSIQIDDVDYTIVNSIGDVLAGSEDIWTTGAMITVVLDVTNAKAYLQSAPTKLLGISRGGTGGTTAADARTNLGAAAKATITTATLATSGWSNGVYSFENTYPHATYDIEVSLHGDSATLAQKQAFDNAQIVGYYSSNKIKAFGIVPTVGIPVIIKAVKKA